MAKLTPLQEALHALRWNLSRRESPMAAQFEDDRLNPDRKRQAAASRLVAGVPAVWVVPSSRWHRCALVTIILGVLTGFYGTTPAAFVIFHLDNVPATAHYSEIQDLRDLTAFGVLIGGMWLTLYFTVRFAKRPSIATSALGVTVFNWKSVTLPWDNITDVILTPASRFTRRGWVPGVVQRDGRVQPVAFAEFLPSRGQVQGPAPEMFTSSGTLEVSALVRNGLDAHNRMDAHAAGTVPDQAVPVTVRHAVDRSGTTHTFCFHRSAHRVFGAGFAIFGVVCLAEAAATPLTAGHLGGSWRDELVVIGVGFLTAWFGVRAFRVRVQVRGEQLTIHDELRTRKVSTHEIRTITLQSKTMSAAGSHWVPRVDLIDGKSVWITNFDCGPADRPPIPGLAATVGEVRALLAARSDDVRRAESPQPNDGAL